MKKHLLVIISFFCFSVFTCRLQGQAPTWSWVRSIQQAPQGEQIVTTTIDAQGYIYVLGIFNDSTIVIGNDTLHNTDPVANQSNNYFVAKYDSAGNALWAFREGGIGSISPTMIKVDSSGSIYVGGEYWTSSLSIGTTTLPHQAAYDIFIVKYDSSRVVKWVKYGTGDDEDQVVDLSVGNSGIVTVGGIFASTYITIDSHDIYRKASSNTGRSMFIVRLDSTGTVLNTKAVGGSSFDYMNNMGCDQYGNIYIDGTYLSRTMYIDTITVNNVASSYGGFVLKLDTSLTAVWVRQVQSKFWNECRMMDVKTDGTTTVSGYFMADTATFGNTILLHINQLMNSEFFIVQYDPTGTIKWAKTFTNGQCWATPFSLVNDKEGNIYMGGYMQADTLIAGNDTLYNGCPPGDGTGDPFVFRYDSLGNMQWAKNVRGNRYDFLFNGLSVDQQENVYASGYYLSDTLHFDGMELINANTDTSNLTSDVFFAKLGRASLTGIEHNSISKNEILLYPNPSRGMIHVHAQSKMDEIVVYTLLGEKVQSIHPNQTDVSLQIKNEGMYVLQIKCGDSSVIKKCLIQH